MDLLDGLPRPDLALEPGAVLLAGFAYDVADILLKAIDVVTTDAPFQHMVTPGGRRMSVAMTICGNLGWVTDQGGYRYDARDPETESLWPAMSAAFRNLAFDAAEAAGYPDFRPNAYLINRYDPGARLTLHQDRNERDLSAPIVSVSLGVSATFLWGGSQRADRPRRVRLRHGDVVVWGGPARLSFHGVDTLPVGQSDLTGENRFNLTLRGVG